MQCGRRYRQSFVCAALCWLAQLTSDNVSFPGIFGHWKSCMSAPVNGAVTTRIHENVCASRAFDLWAQPMQPGSDADSERIS